MLILSNLINGTYNFSLTVTNSKGKRATDNVTLTVLPNPMEEFVIQVYLDDEISTFTKDDQVRVPSLSFSALHSLSLLSVVSFSLQKSLPFSSPY